jgi:hypothetical protein
MTLSKKKRGVASVRKVAFMGGYIDSPLLRDNRVFIDM